MKKEKIRKKSKIGCIFGTNPKLGKVIERKSREGK